MEEVGDMCVEIDERANSMACCGTDHDEDGVEDMAAANLLAAFSSCDVPELVAVDADAYNALQDAIEEASNLPEASQADENSDNASEKSDSEEELLSHLLGKQLPKAMSAEPRTSSEDAS